jgi:hypothetical protein
MAPTNDEWLKKRMKALRRVLTSLDAEEREFKSRGFEMPGFAELRKSYEKMLSDIETKTKVN